MYGWMGKRLHEYAKIGWNKIGWNRIGWNRIG